MNNINILKPRISPYLRTIALVLCVCLLVTDVAQAAPLERGSSHVSRRTEINSHNTLSEKKTDLEFPKKLGTVEEMYHSPRAPDDGQRETIYYIQDAHDSLEAQKNIARIIQYLVAQHGVKTVFEEGYEGPVPTDKYFGGIKNREIKRKVAQSLMEKMLIGGAEFAHILRAERHVERVAGKKELELYTANDGSPTLGSKKEAQSARHTARGMHHDFRLIGADNVQLHLENIEWYRQSALTREETAAELKGLTAKLQPLAERDLPPKIKHWIRLRERFDTGKLDVIEYLKRLTSLGAAASEPQVFSLNASYFNIRLILEAQKTGSAESFSAVQKVSHRELFREIDAFENAFAATNIQSLKQRRLFRYVKTLRQLQRLNELEISFEEYEALRTVLKNFKTEELLRFVARETHRSLALPKKWEANIKQAMRFFELAKKRDRAIEKTLIRYQNDSPAVLVFGGFHKENIKEILRRNGYSYFVITPKISRISNEQRALYRQLMSRGVPGFLMPAASRIATRYAPIFEMGEYLGQRDRINAVIQAEAARALARSEMRTQEDAAEPNTSPQKIVVDDNTQIEEPYDFFRALKHSAVWGWSGAAVFNFPLTVMEHRFLGWLAISFGTTLGLTEIRGVIAGDYGSIVRLVSLPPTMWFLSFLHFREWRRARFIYEKARRYDKNAAASWNARRLKQAEEFESETGWKINWTSDPLALAVMDRKNKKISMTVGWIMQDLSAAEGRSANSYFSHTLRTMRAAIDEENEKLERAEKASRSEVRAFHTGGRGSPIEKFLRMLGLENIVNATGTPWPEDPRWESVLISNQPGLMKAFIYEKNDKTERSKRPRYTLRLMDSVNLEVFGENGWERSSALKNQQLAVETKMLALAEDARIQLRLRFQRSAHSGSKPAQARASRLKSFEEFVNQQLRFLPKSDYTLQLMPVGTRPRSGFFVRAKTLPSKPKMLRYSFYDHPTETIPAREFLNDLANQLRALAVEIPETWVAMAIKKFEEPVAGPLAEVKPSQPQQEFDVFVDFNPEGQSQQIAHELVQRMPQHAFFSVAGSKGLTLWLEQDVGRSKVYLALDAGDSEDARETAGLKKAKELKEQNPGLNVFHYDIRRKILSRIKTRNTKDPKKRTNNTTRRFIYFSEGALTDELILGAMSQALAQAQKPVYIREPERIYQPDIAVQRQRGWRDMVNFYERSLELLIRSEKEKLEESTGGYFLEQPEEIMTEEGSVYHLRIAGRKNKRFLSGERVEIDLGEKEKNFQGRVLRDTGNDLYLKLFEGRRIPQLSVAGVVRKAYADLTEQIQLTLLRDLKNGEPVSELVWQVLGLRPTRTVQSTEEQRWIELKDERILNFGEQLAVIGRSLAGKSLEVVVGPPGTGKTSTSAELVQQIVAERIYQAGVRHRESLVVMSQTHRAADNLLLALKAAGQKIIRLGSDPSEFDPQLREDWIFARAPADRMSPEFRRWEAELLEKVRRGEVIVGGTITGVLNSFFVQKLSKRGEEFLFDRGIIEEASVIPIPQGLVALSKISKQAFLVGDPNQLGVPRPTQEQWRYFEAHGMERTSEHEFQMSRNILDAVLQLKEVEPLRLYDNFRSPEVLVELTNFFYGGLLRPKRKISMRANRRSLIVIDTKNLKGGQSITAEGETSLENAEEQQILNRLLDGLSALDQKALGIVTPYRAQAQGVEDLIARRLELAPQQMAVHPVFTNIGTAWPFQGREFPIMIILGVVSNAAGDFITPEMMNVLTSRAKNSQVVVFNSQAYLRSRNAKVAEFTRKLIELASKKGMYVELQTNTVTTQLSQVSSEFEAVVETINDEIETTGRRVTPFRFSARSEVRAAAEKNMLLKELEKRILFSSDNERDQFLRELEEARRSLVGARYKNVDALMLQFVQQLGRPLWTARMKLSGYRVERRTAAEAFQVLRQWKTLMIDQKPMPRQLDWARVAWNPVTWEDILLRTAEKVEKPTNWVSLKAEPVDSLLWETARDELMRLGLAPLQIGDPEELIKQGDNAVTLAVIHPANHNDIVKLREGAKHANVNLLLVLPNNVVIGRGSDGREIFGAQSAIVFKEDQPYWIEFAVPLRIDYLMNGEDKFQKRFRANGIPTAMDPTKARYFNDKDLTEEILMTRGIATPPSGVILRPRSKRQTLFSRVQIFRQKRFFGGRMAELETFLRNFMDRHQLVEIVLKPVDGSQGYGVTFFNRMDLEPAYQKLKTLKLQRILAGLRSKDMLIQGRVIPELIHHKPAADSEPIYLDWNLRVLISLNEQNQPVISGIVARTGYEETAVNISQGSGVMLLEQVVAELNLTAEEQGALTREIEMIAQKTFEAMQDRAQKDGVLAPGENVSDFMGLDLMVAREDGQLKPYVIEVNGSNSGGLWALDSLLEKKHEQEPTAQQEHLGKGVRDWVRLAERRALAYKKSLQGETDQFSQTTLPFKQREYVDEIFNYRRDALNGYRQGKLLWWSKVILRLAPLVALVDLMIHKSKTSLILPSLLYFAAGGLMVFGIIFYERAQLLQVLRLSWEFWRRLYGVLRDNRIYSEIWRLTQERKAARVSDNSTPQDIKIPVQNQIDPLQGDPLGRSEVRTQALDSNQDGLAKHYIFNPESAYPESLDQLENEASRKKMKKFLKYISQEFLGSPEEYGRRLDLIFKHGPYLEEQMLDLIDTTYDVLARMDQSAARERYQAASWLLLLGVNESYLKKVFPATDAVFDRDLGRDYLPGHREALEQGLDPGYFWYDSTVSDAFKKSVNEIEQAVDYGNAKVALHALAGVGRDAFLMARRWPQVKVLTLDANVFNLREALERLQERAENGVYYPNLRLIHTDARASKQGIPLPEGSVDRIIFVGLAAASMLRGEVSEIMREVFRVTSKHAGKVFFDFDSDGIPEEIRDAIDKTPGIQVEHQRLSRLGEMLYGSHLLTVRSEVRSTAASPDEEEALANFEFPANKVERAILKFQADFPPELLAEAVRIIRSIQGQTLTIRNLKRSLPDSPDAASKRMVFTGAPYGGKTTFLKKMTSRYKDEAIYIPEVIHILKEAEIDLAGLQGQRVVYALKYILEQAAARIYPNRLVFIDRGTLDGAAYWPRGREAFLREIGGKRSEYERYGAVIQMQSVAAAKHAAGEYHNRAESPERAAEIDQALEEIWRNHGRYYRVPHSEWEEKTRQAEAIVDFVKSRLLAGAKAPLVFDFEHHGQRYHYPNIAAYDFDPQTLKSFLSREHDSNVQAPLVMDLHFKAPCGLRCVFCYTEGGVTDERHAIDEEKFGTMEPDDIREAIRQYAALGGHTLILLSIGEPLTDVNQFLEYAELAQKLGVRVVTFTNMLLITPDVAERLRRAEVNMLLKLNHLNPKINNQLAGRAKPYKYIEYKGQKIPQQLVNVLEAYRDRPDLLAISSDITRLNADNILEISRWAYEALGVAHFRKHLYYFGFAQANRDLLVLSDEEALAFDKKVYAFDRQYGYQYPAPENFNDQYSFDMRRFLNNNASVSGFPVRTFAHYLSGIYHSSGVVQPKYGYKKGIKVALKSNETGRVDAEDFFRQIFRHILFFKGVSKRLEEIESSFQSDRTRLFDHVQSQASRQRRWEDAYRLTVDIKKYLAEHGADLAVPDRRKLRGFLKRATELARENVLYWVPKTPGISVIDNDQLRTAYPAGEKFQFFSLEGESVFYTDPYQVTYSIVPPQHEQAIHGHFFTPELTVALDPGLQFHLFKFENGRVTHREAYDVPEFSAAAFDIRTPHSLLNPTERPVRNMTVKYGIQVTDRWDLKEAPSEDTFTFEGRVVPPLVETISGAEKFSFEKKDLYHQVIVVKPGGVYPYELAGETGKGWFVAEGTVQVSAPLLDKHNVVAENGSIVYAYGGDKPGMILFSNEGTNRVVLTAVDLKKSPLGRFQSALKKTYQALITDVDGVLTEPGSANVSKQALEFLAEKIQQGTPVMLISGRNETAFGQGYRKQAPSLEEVAVKLRELLVEAGQEQALAHLFLASENGAVITNGFSREDARRIDYPTDLKIREMSLRDQTSIIDRLKALGLVDEHVTVENKTHGFVLKDSFGTRVDGIEQELERELKARELWDYVEIASSKEEGSVYVYPRGSNKRRGLDFMVQSLGIEPLEIAAFADRGARGELDYELLEAAAGFSTDTVEEGGGTVSLRGLSGYLPGYQSFLWAASQMKFADTASSLKMRSEVRGDDGVGSETGLLLDDARSQRVLNLLESMEQAIEDKKSKKFWRLAKQLDRQNVIWALVGDEGALEGWQGKRPKVFGRLARREVSTYFFKSLSIQSRARQRVSRTLEAHMLDIPEGGINIVIARKITRNGQAYLHTSRSEFAGTLAKSLFYYMTYGYMEAISLTRQFDAFVPLPKLSGREETKTEVLRGGSYSSIERLVHSDGSSVIVKRADTGKDKGKLRREAEYMRSLQQNQDPAGAFFPKVYSITTEGSDTVVVMEDALWPSLTQTFQMTNLPGQNGLLPESASQHNRFQMSQKIYKALTPVFYGQKQSDTPPDFLERFHFQKVEERWREAESRSTLLKELFAAPYLEVRPASGGFEKNFPNLKTGLNLLRRVSELHPELFTPPYLSKQHGDLHFGNILMDPFSFFAEGDDDDFKLVDPKYISEGNDPLYDFAKLMHNYYGHYDLALNLSGSYHFAIRLPKTPGAPARLEENSYDEHSAAARMMEAVKAYESDVRRFLREPDASLFPFEKPDGFWKYRLLFTHATLMAGLLPFHVSGDTHESKDSVLYERTAELFYELIKKLWQDGWMDRDPELKQKTAGLWMTSYGDRAGYLKNINELNTYLEHAKRSEVRERSSARTRVETQSILRQLEITLVETQERDIEKTKPDIETAAREILDDQDYHLFFSELEPSVRAWAFKNGKQYTQRLVTILREAAQQSESAIQNYLKSKIVSEEEIALAKRVRETVTEEALQAIVHQVLNERRGKEPFFRHDYNILGASFFGSLVSSSLTPQSDVDYQLVVRDRRDPEFHVPEFNEHFNMAFQSFLRTNDLSRGGVTLHLAHFGLIGEGENGTDAGAEFRGARSETRRSEILSQRAILERKNIQDITMSAAVFLDAGELVRLRPVEADQRMDELLALLTQSKALDIYLDGTDRYPVENIMNKRFQTLLAQYSERIHIGKFDRARLAQKKIVIQASLFQTGDRAEATLKMITRLKQNYKIAGDVLPLEYTKPGALKAFLSLAELGSAAELIRKVSDFYAVRGPNGRWQIGEAYLASVWRDFTATTAVAWAA